MIILPLEYSYSSSIRSCRIKTILGGRQTAKGKAEREKNEKEKNFSYLCHRIAHTKTKTHKDTHTEAVSGTTEVLWVAVMLLAASISV